MFALDATNKCRVLSHRTDLGTVANDTRVRLQGFELLVAEHRAGHGVERVKRGLEAIPLRVHHAPDEARPEDSPRHRRQPAIISHVGKGTRRPRRRQSISKCFRAAAALDSTLFNLQEVTHAPCSRRSPTYWHLADTSPSRRAPSA